MIIDFQKGLKNERERVEWKENEAYIIFLIYPGVDRSEPKDGRIEMTVNIFHQARQMHPMAHIV